MAEAIDELTTGKRIAPHVDRVLPLDRWREAFDAMANGDIIGKLVLEP
ncbi:MAG: zinc-binding dehydrogenase [Pseudomonadota bacterium]|nr:zinc-binding dehydrogenase [Pseudomonadota bacterium]